jgi:pyruvate dehydrogenase E1 component alpha subunit
MNLAGIWKLPVLFVCENNFFQESVPVSRHSSHQELYTRAAGYHIPGYELDGMDVSAVYEAALEAVRHIRSGEGAVMLECKTYRYHGHARLTPQDEISNRRDCLMGERSRQAADLLRTLDHECGLEDRA